MRGFRVRRLTMVVGSLLGLLVFGGCSAWAAGAAAPGFAIESLAMPTNFSQASGGTYHVTVTNVGSVASSGEIVITDTLPVGLTAQEIEFYRGAEGVFDLGFLCDVGTVKCRWPGPVAPDEPLKMIVHVAVGANAPEVLVNRASVAMGGVPAGSVEAQNELSEAPAAFGPANFSFAVNGPNGLPETQAGGHPYEMTVTFGLNNVLRTRGPLSRPAESSVQDVKDVVLDLPLGFVASTLAAPECTFAQLSSGNGCPPDTIVGHIYSEPLGASVNSAIYNMVPERGVPGEFGFFDTLDGAHILYAHVVPTPAGYVLQAVSQDIPAIPLTRIVTTLYGDPAERQKELAAQEERIVSPIPPVPYFTNPTDCSGEPMVATIYMDSWKNPAKLNPDGTAVDLNEPQWANMQSSAPAVTGCDGLQFPAEFVAQPTTHEADKPSGLDSEIKIPQVETMGVPATPTMRKAVVTFPEGFTVDPSAGGGLAACSEAQIGWEEARQGPMKFNAAAPQCPEASKIGMLELESPLIGHRLEGEMFLASQNENPFHSTLATYVVVNDPVTGVVLKVAGEVQADKQTGRLTARFDENPNLPFSDLKLRFFGGPRAEFATPESCGTFTTVAELTPWSAPDSGPPATPFDSFLINEACPGGFSPEFIALSSNVQAGAFTPFEASLARSDTDQELAGLSFTLPEGLLGKIAGVSLCTDQEIHAAEAGTGGCPQASQVGTVQTAAGPGPNPLTVAGKAYLTGPYNGGPYGLAVVVPAVAGPFNFGTIVVRQSIRIDPHTAQVTDVSDPFPTIVDGIALRLRRVNVTLDRPQFTFNPTSCDKEQFAGTISGSPLGAPRTLNGIIGYAAVPGATAPLSVPFEVTDCKSLAFAPKLTVRTKGHASKNGGASLLFKIAYPKGAMGSQSWLNEAKFDIPKQFPARLTTIQKACPAATFEHDRAACPAASIIGRAIVHSEVLPESLQGPVYFVSYGGAKFPDAVLVLNGNNVTIEQHGTTFINSKTGITSATFHAIPDVPVESIEVNVPAGPHGEFGVNLPAKDRYNLCGQTLKMPTFFKASNGLEQHQTTKVKITGCKKVKHRHKQGRKTRHAWRRK